MTTERDQCVLQAILNPSLPGFVPTSFSDIKFEGAKTVSDFKKLGI
jgi:hypothetical protein